MQIFREKQLSKVSILGESEPRLVMFFIFYGFSYHHFVLDREFTDCFEKYKVPLKDSIHKVAKKLWNETFLSSSLDDLQHAFTVADNSIFSRIFGQSGRKITTFSLAFETIFSFARKGSGGQQGRLPFLIGRF